MVSPPKDLRLPHWIGAAGLICLVLGVFGLVSRVDLTLPTPKETSSVGGDIGLLAYYPLEVGRYWIYQHPSDREVARETKRRIIRRQRRSDEELFFFDDGTIARFEGAKVYEMGPNGGVNVIPLAFSTRPYTYSTQGLRIEKWVGTVGTPIEVNGHNYQDCLEIVTRFHRQEGGDGKGAAFASYYARGIGMVGRGPWPRQRDEPLSVALRDFGIEQL